MFMSVRDGDYRIKTFLGKLLYIAFLLHGGIYSETTVKMKFKILCASVALYNVSVGVVGPTLFLLLHGHNLSTTQMMFVAMIANGMPSCYLSKILQFVYRDSIKASIKSMENHFYTDLHRRVAKSRQTEAMNVTKGVHALFYASIFGMFMYIFSRLIGLAILGSENMGNVFFHICPLPLEFIEKRCGPATTYWLTFCLTAPAFANILFTTFSYLQIVCVIPSVACNHFWYLRCLIVDESRVSTLNFEEHTEKRESEARKVARLHHYYVRYYQVLVREMDEARAYMEMNYTIVFAGTFAGSIPAGILLVANEDVPLCTVLTFYGVLLPCIVAMIIFSFCGSFFEEINSELILCLYESPWMYLRPRQRQHLITFMSMLQSPLTYNIFKIRPLSVVLLLRFWQVNYTINNFFRMSANI